MKIKKYKTCREYRDAIRILYKEGLNYEGYKMCLEFKSAIQNNEIEYTDNDIWSCCVVLSIGYERLGSLNMATYYAKTSLMYARNSIEFFKSKMMLGICYQLTKKYDKALEIYDNCIEMCDNSINQLNSIEFKEELKPLLECKAGFLRNKGKILGDELCIYKAINIYKQLHYDNELKNKIIQNKIDKAYKVIEDIRSKSEIKHYANAL